MFEYRVLIKKDRPFSGGFNYAELERTLNDEASSGWRLAEGFTAGSVILSHVRNT